WTGPAVREGGHGRWRGTRDTPRDLGDGDTRRRVFLTRDWGRKPPGPGTERTLGMVERLRSRYRAIGNVVFFGARGRLHMDEEQHDLTGSEGGVAYVAPAPSTSGGPAQGRPRAGERPLAGSAHGR